MTVLSRLVRATDWRYAIGEVALIFVGITLALLANSWYEDLKDREEEREVLQQLVIGLDADIAALERNRTRIESKVRTMKQLEQHIQDELPYNSALDNSFKEILTGGSARLNTAAFESLKYRGIDLISSPSLRGQLVDYYDTEKSLLEQRNSSDQGDQWAAEPYFKKNFRWDSDQLLMRPIEYESLVNDTEFLNILSIRIWALNNLASGIYARIEGKARDLRTAVLDHLEDLS